jgi:dTDP-4-amino-4,6-dideoxy-D-glucose acyltransferase
MMASPPNFSTNYSVDDLSTLGLAEVGDNVRIDRRAAFFGIEHIRIGSNVRIDCFCVITASEVGPVTIGSHVHLATGVTLLGAAAGIEIGDLCTLAPKVSVFSAVEDYTGGAIATPMVPIEYRDPVVAPVAIGPHVIIGASSVIVAGVSIGWGSAVGALSLVSRDVAPGSVVAGCPARAVRERPINRLETLEADFIRSMGAERRGG